MTELALTLAGRLPCCLDFDVAAAAADDFWELGCLWGRPRLAEVFGAVAAEASES